MFGEYLFIRKKLLTWCRQVVWGVRATAPSSSLTHTPTHSLTRSAHHPLPPLTLTLAPTPTQDSPPDLPPPSPHSLARAHTHCLGGPSSPLPSASLATRRASIAHSLVSRCLQSLWRGSGSEGEVPGIVWWRIKKRARKPCTFSRLQVFPALSLFLTSHPHFST